MNWLHRFRWLAWVNGQRLFKAIALTMSALFAWGFFSQAGLPPTEIEQNWLSLVFALVFFLLPFAKKLDVFHFLSFEAKIDQVKKDVGEANERLADVKTDIRHVIHQQNALSATFQSLQNQAVTVNNYTGVTEQQTEAAVAAVADVEPADPADSDLLSKEISSEELIQAIFQPSPSTEGASPERTIKLADLFSNVDSIRELRQINLSERAAILRVRIEGELKRLLRPHAEASRSRIFQAMRFSQRELLNNVIEYHPELAEQRKSFDVFFRIANLAVHADEIPTNDLDIAIYLGQRLLGLLQKIDPTPPFQSEFDLDQ